MKTFTEALPKTNISFNMIRIEGGTFTMGCTEEQGSDCDDDENPPHQVRLSSFYMAEMEVTQELWRTVMGSNPSYLKGKNCPVESVSWDDIQEFLKKLKQLTGKNYRLPIEAEWEYAARDGTKSLGYKYAGSDEIDDVAWYNGNSGNKTHPVGQKSPNELGLYDMSGNVWEWCQDWYGSEYYAECEKEGVMRNPKGSSSDSAQVLRGGSWNYFPQNCRVAYRDYFTPTDTSSDCGFRIALNV